MNYKQQIINEVVQAIKAKGYRVFMAKSGEYGFYTDQDGNKIISFQSDLGGVTVSGNYKTNKPSSCGTGWRIADQFQTADIDAYFNAYAPQWALNGASYTFTTLEQHLATYQSSSNYSEV